MNMPLSAATSETLEEMKTSARAELGKILEWWALHMIDHTHGGFYGRTDGRGKRHPEADKGVILNTRILWTFSAAARQPGFHDDNACAERAFVYLTQNFWDERAGGFYWMLDYKGQPVQTKKQIYAQAFAIYAMAEFYRLTGRREALERANETFWLIEENSRDVVRGGYFEAFAADWSPLADLRLSEKDANEAKTMNTHLHVLEAYTTLLRAAPSGEVHDALRSLTELFLEKFLDPDTAHFRLFFTENWELRSDLISFGHDIEAAWLLCDAAESLGDQALLEKTRAAAVRVADRTLRSGVDPSDGGLWNEADSLGLTDRNKDWWPQAEAVIGFLYALHISGEARFADAALRSWAFIQQHLKDEQNGEWFWAVKADGTPDLENDKAGPWKCPYHNGRACLKIAFDEFKL